VTRRWYVLCLAALAVLMLACEGAGNAAPSPTGKPKPGLPASMAALGDSITAGVGSCFPPTRCQQNSWSTGSNPAVDSHYRRIRAGNKKIAGRARNFSVPGARAADLQAQAVQAVKAKVAYVTILIGANDACAPSVAQMTTSGLFRDGVDAALHTLKKGLPKARVLVVSVPDLYHLWETGHTSPAARLAWALGECPSLLDNPTSTAPADNQRRHAVDDRVTAYDRELAAACSAYGRKCRWDGGKVHSVHFSLAQVSTLDYFHPSKEGQKELASVTYPGKFTW
jgi:lysophospholipase L1-like esterase